MGPEPWRSKVLQSPERGVAGICLCSSGTADSWHHFENSLSLIRQLPLYNRCSFHGGVESTSRTQAAIVQGNCSTLCFEYDLKSHKRCGYSGSRGINSLRRIVAEPL